MMVGVVLVILLWAYFRPSIDWTDLSFSTRGLRRHKYWRNTWLTWFAFRCWQCGAWGGCGEHWLCGICESCKIAIESDEYVYEDEP